MTKAVIIEDEKLAVNAITHALAEIPFLVQIESVLGSVAGAKEYFAVSPAPDIIFSDIQLPDGYSFKIFGESKIKSPVIFVTAYDAYMMNAFEFNGIDYLLKPVNKKELEKALFKYGMLKKHFSNQNEAVQRFAYHFENKKKNRLLVKRGLEFISLLLDDVILFYTENKLVFVVDRSGKKYITEHNLSELEELLDNSRFFRANRQYIVNINFIKGFRSLDRVKLLVDLNIPDMNHHVVISQENSSQFREWMYNA
jgi:DNA-binding LytR/AlgR family response regulator